jgi:hypothetical protein
MDIQDILDVNFTIPEVRAKDYLQTLTDYINANNNDVITADELVWLFNDMVKEGK